MAWKSFWSFDKFVIYCTQNFFTLSKDIFYFSNASFKSSRSLGGGLNFNQLFCYFMIIYWISDSWNRKQKQNFVRTDGIYTKQQHKQRPMHMRIVRITYTTANSQIHKHKTMRISVSVAPGSDPLTVPKIFTAKPFLMTVMFSFPGIKSGGRIWFMIDPLLFCWSIKASALPGIG